MLKRVLISTGLLVVFALLGSSAVSAQTSVTLAASGSDSDGPVAATVTFTPLSGEIEITITNTESGTLAKGQAVSDLSFTVGNGLAAPTAFTELTGESYSPSSGASWTSSSGTSFDNTSSASPPNAIDHWGFSVTGGNVLLATANSPVPGAGNPHYMILPSSGKAGPGSSLANSNFYPYIIGPATFYITDSGVTTTTDLAADISSVELSFGTGPDVTLPATVVPEPESMLLFGTGLLFILIVSRKLLFA